MQGMSGKIPDMPCTKRFTCKVQRQICIGTLVSNQARRAAVVPRFNRWFCSSIGLNGGSYVLASRDMPRTVFFRFSSVVSKVRRSVVFWSNRSVGVPSCPSPPRPAAQPGAAPPRPARGTYVWVLESTSEISLVVLPKILPGLSSLVPWRRKGNVVLFGNRPAGLPARPALLRPTLPRFTLPRRLAAQPYAAPAHRWYVRILNSILYLSNPKPGHTAGGAVRGGPKQGGGAGRDRAGPDADGSVRPGHN